MPRRPQPEPQWRNRVKELRYVSPRDLADHPHQWREHPDHQRSALRGVLQEIGIAGALLAYESPTTGQLTSIDGHLRKSLGDTPWPTLILDVTDEEAALLLATHDPLAALAEANTEELTRLLHEVQSGDAAVQQMLSELAQREGIVPLDDNGVGGNGAGCDVEPQIDRAAELQTHWETEVGQLWQLGTHRLICGDCTDKTIVASLMGGSIVDLGVTSPPYAVGKEYEKDTSFAEHLALLRGMADRALDVIKPGGFLFTNFGEIASQSHAGPLTGSNRQCLYLISKDYWQIFHVERKMDLYAQRIWYKPFNRLQQPFWTYHTSIPHHQEWEHIWTWRLPGGDGDTCQEWDISVRAVWDTRQEATNDKPLTRHTAAFPVCLPERALRAHSAPGALVWDPFCGSGTTLIACENLGRCCYGCELSPGYVAVTLERWHTLTGEMPQRLA